MTDLVKFDGIKIADALRDKIRSELLTLIPDETWTAMIAAEIDVFMKDRTERRVYGGFNSNEASVVPAGFKIAVREVLAEETKRRVKEVLCSPDWQSQWDGQTHSEVGQALKELISEATPAVMRAVLRDGIANIVQQLRHQ